MVCTFGDLTDVMWWRELRLPVRSVLGPDGRLLDVPWGAPGWESADLERAPRELRRAGGQRRSTRRAGASSSCWSEDGDLVGEPQPVTRAVKFFEKGERPVEIVTSRQWFIRTIEHRDALLERGRELQLAPAVHARPLRGLGERPERRLVRQPPALLRRAVPGLVSARRRRHGALRRADRCGARSSCRSTPRPMCPTATRPPSAGSRAASSATPT